MRIGLAVLGVATTATVATAEPLELGGFFGPRRFAPDAVLGADGDAATSLGSTVVFGPRLSLPLVRWLTPEFELALSPATTRDFDVGVFWLEPRALVRVDLRPRARLRPFVALGVGMPTALSSKRGLYDSGVTVEGLAALGLAWNPGRGLAVRLDARFGVAPARADAVRPVAFEGEILLGLYVPLGRRASAAARAVGPVEPLAADRDDDGVDDRTDACPTRAEDHDGFEDLDGCPDIDNDLDHVLDIADKCSSVAETYNGFDDDDGCPDLVPPAIDAVIGTVEGLLYREGDTEVRALAAEGLDKLALALTQHPGVRVILVGHTDDREAVPAPVEGEAPADPPPDPEAAAVELGRDRARAVRAALIERGIASGRLVVDSAGAGEPVSDNDTPRGRLRNRRVELRLYVAKPGV